MRVGLNSAIVSGMSDGVEFAIDADGVALLRVNREQGTTVVVVTHDPEVAARLPRTVTIRDGRIGGEGRSGQEYAVVTADGFVPLPAHIREELPPGTLLRIEPSGEGYLLVPEVKGEGGQE